MTTTLSSSRTDCHRCEGGAPFLAGRAPGRRHRVAAGRRQTRPPPPGRPAVRTPVAWVVVPPEDARSTRRYFIRTFGCQMNEHDSERLAGLLEADGMVPATDAAEADVIVVNTCCIRENADNKLYGNLGMLKAAKDQRPDLQLSLIHI